jgi:hypothetical protein
MNDFKSVLQQKKFLTRDDIGNRKKEKQRFKEKITRMLSEGNKIYLQLGFGKNPFSNFLNLDIRFFAKANIPVEMFDNVFFFDWLDSPLPIPDNSVDFVFHQDMFEHLSQMQQFLLLSEVWRVLKPECFHRINAPCLADSMRTHSNFTKGYKGVYKDEWEKWGHVNLHTATTLNEISRIVGYSDVQFNSKNGSVSGVEFVESRPGKDRNSVTGNVFADLMK